MPQKRLTNSHRLLHLLQLFHIHDCGSKTFVGDEEGREEGDEDCKAVGAAVSIHSRWVIRRFILEMAEMAVIRTGVYVVVFLGLQTRDEVGVGSRCSLWER